MQSIDTPADNDDILYIDLYWMWECKKNMLLIPTEPICFFCLFLILIILTAEWSLFICDEIIFGLAQLQQNVLPLVDVVSFIGGKNVNEWLRISRNNNGDAV